MSKKAVILLSGGLDSATCLGLAKREGYECYTMAVDYGQRHRSELDASAKLSAKMLAKDHKVMAINLNVVGGSALTDHSINVPSHTDSTDDIPITYVPARNTLFLSLALGYAEVIDAKAIYIGVSSVDYSGYPDCRPEYLAAYQDMANLATKRAVEGNPITIKAPLAHLSKSETIQLGIDAGVDYALTISCYQADENGRACGHCESCALRKKGFVEAGITDPTCYV